MRRSKTQVCSLELQTWSRRQNHPLRPPVQRFLWALPYLPAPLSSHHFLPHECFCDSRSLFLLTSAFCAWQALVHLGSHISPVVLPGPLVPVCPSRTLGLASYKDLRVAVSPHSLGARESLVTAREGSSPRQDACEGTE